MSEPIAGMPEMPRTVVPAKDAAAVIVFRRNAGHKSSGAAPVAPTVLPERSRGAQETPDRPSTPLGGNGSAQPGVELFWLKREQKLAFAGGFYAFAGGRLDAADAKLPVEGATGLDAALIVCAARELLEETGLLIVRGSTTQAQRDAMRKELLDASEADRKARKSGSKPAESNLFAALLDRHSLKLNAADFPAAGRWVTPTFMPGRFDARFFLVEAPADQLAQVWPGELTEGEWITPAAALERWKNGTALLHPPNLHAVRTLGAFKDLPSTIAALKNQPFCTDFIAERLEFQEGIRVFPLETATLPPATHTNTYVLGRNEVVVVDPGSSDPAEMEKLLAFLRTLESEGVKLKAIVLTHHHGDHLGGLDQLVAATKLPIWCHARTADRLSHKTARLLDEGDVLGLAEVDFTVRFTPGHARGHICLFEQRSNAAVVGDMVAGIGTIVIDPPEGDMAEYLKQLARLKALGVTTVYPAHGPAIPDGPAKLDQYLAHRAWRETKVLDAVTTSPQPIDAVVTKAYDDVQAFVWPLAERNTLAILEKLAAEGRVSRAADGWKRN